jgi:hypothetical protein
MAAPDQVRDMRTASGSGSENRTAATRQAIALDAGRVREVMAIELFAIYTRLAFGATMILAALCVVFEQIGGAL